MKVSEVGTVRATTVVNKKDKGRSSKRCFFIVVEVSSRFLLFRACRSKSLDITFTSKKRWLGICCADHVALEYAEETF